ATALTEVMLDAGGAPTEAPHPVGAYVSHDGAVLEATFSPAEIELPYGHFRWSFQSEWTGAPACGSSAPCGDRIPLTGALGGVARLLVEPYCFGAAARDPGRPCSNPRLRRSVVPAPEDALITLNAPCARMAPVGLVHACAFGVSTRRALDSA